MKDWQWGARLWPQWGRPKRLAPAGAERIGTRVLTVTEPEPRDTGVGPHRERVAGQVRVVIAGGLEALDDLQAARPRVLERLPDRLADLRLPRRKSARKQLHQVGAGEVLAQRLRSDHQRVEQSAGAVIAGSMPISPARQARSVPWPLPVALRLPNRWTLRLSAWFCWSAGSFAARW